MMKSKLFYILLVLSISAVCFGKADLPMPRHYVEDYANVINSSDERSLNGILQELEQKTGTQYIVLTVQTTSGVPIEQYSIELAEKWKLGQKDEDNGFLFVLAMQDRKYRFEVGYGLESFITDSYCGRIGREVLRPYMRSGQASTGIYQANLRIVQKIASEYGVSLTGMPKIAPAPNSSRRRQAVPCCGAIPFFIFFILIFGMRSGMLWWFFPFMLGRSFGSRGYGRSGSYGGGSFGGSFGGFGGGMGGGFGGGGASGGW